MNNSDPFHGWLDLFLPDKIHDLICRKYLSEFQQQTNEFPNNIGVSYIDIVSMDEKYIVSKVEKDYSEINCRMEFYVPRIVFHSKNHIKRKVNQKPP